MCAVFIATLTALPQAARAQAYPSKPIRIIVPQGPGGTSDLLSRAVAQKLNDAFGQQVVVDNRPGANGIIGTEMGAKAAADGYTLTFGSSPTHAINPGLYRKLSYDPLADFAPIGMLGRPLYAVIAHPAIATNIKDFIETAKMKPGTLNFGAGSSNAWIGTELFAAAAGIKLLHVPYKSNSQALIDLVGGRVDVMIEPVMSALPQIQSGKVSALAVTKQTRLAILPAIPTLTESGVPYKLTPWAAMYAPAGTPNDIVRRLNAEIVKMLKMSDVIERFSALGFEPEASTPEQLGAFTQQEIAEYGRIIKEIGIPMQ